LPGRAAEVVAVSALAALVTVAMAAFVLRAPSDRLFGMEIVGRHHDPFTVMAQFGRPMTFGVYSQPATDLPGALLARLTGPVAAYNWLVLLTFPLSAAAAYLLARYLTLSRVGATVAAMAYAFSPFHVAQAAYHPHIAQTQWIPLYLLALWRCLDAASPRAVALLAAAAMAVTLSNFYAGLIMGVMTPIAVAAYWLVTARPDSQSTRRLAITAGALLAIAAGGVAYASTVVVDRSVFAFPRADLFRYSAKWWGYLVPPAAHPLLGETAHRVWSAVDVREGLLEQQVSLGWGIVALGLIAVWRWLGSDKQPSLARVPVLVIVAMAALVCSLSPERTIGAFNFVRPSALLYYVAPMFRSYARFGVVVQLMAALLAGVGVDYLLRGGTRRAQIACLALVALAAGEYAVAPSALWRDAMPTKAHRWVTQQPGRVRALDCTPSNRESAPVQWLTGNRVTSQGRSTNDCTEPNVSGKLAAFGYTHLLVRRDTADGLWFAAHPAVDGLRAAANLADAQVFAITASTPAIYTATMTGFSPRERDGTWSWRWMGDDAAWTIVNTSAQPIVTGLAIELSAFHRARQMELRLDGRPVGNVQTLIVEPSKRRIYEIGPLTVPPGIHELAFHPIEAATVARDVIDNGDGSGRGDKRRLSFAVGTWRWDVQGEQP
jgi:hypothetical protein